jgi:hypothetical protein
MLWRLKLEYDNGSQTDEVIYSNEPLTIYPKRDKIKSSIAQVFKYEVESFIPPILFSDMNGIKYIMPHGMKVHPETQMSDIKWTKWVSDKEKQRKKEEKKEITNTWQFESKSEPGTFYTVTLTGDKLKCNCAGMWRSKTRTCKHMKSVQESLATHK